MAPLNKRRHSTRRGGKRKAAIKLTLSSNTSHRAKIEDGYYVYNGKKIAKA